MVEVAAPAKVNLFLRILARETSGYHQLETLFCALEFGDRLSLEKAPSGVTLQVHGDLSIPPADNLVFRAAKRFLEEGEVREGVRIRLTKRIPAGAGLGGGSSDAAATLLALASLFPDSISSQRLLEIAGVLGSDVPFFLSPSPLSLAWGRGERLLPLPPLPPRPVVLALPRQSVSTAEAYAGLTNQGSSRGPGPGPGVLTRKVFSGWPEVDQAAWNDFESVVFGEYPALGDLRDGLKVSGASVCLLAGSGAAVFGLYDYQDAAGSARDTLEQAFPETRFVLTRTAGADTAWPGPPETIPGDDSGGRENAGA